MIYKLYAAFLQTVIIGKFFKLILRPLRLGKTVLIKEHQKVLAQQHPESLIPHLCLMKPGKALIPYLAVSLSAKHQETTAAKLVGLSLKLHSVGHEAKV